MTIKLPFPALRLRKIRGQQSLHAGLLLSAGLLLRACGQSDNQISVSSDERAATATTIAANRQVAEQLNLNDQQDFNDARRGLIASPENLQVASLARVMHPTASTPACGVRHS